MGHMFLQIAKNGDAEGVEETNPETTEGGEATNEKATIEVPSDPLPSTTIDGISAVAALIIVSFAVDRFASAMQYLFSFLPNFDREFPAPDSPNGRRLADQLRQEPPPDADVETLRAIAKDAEKAVARRHRVLYYFIAALGAGMAAKVGDMQILHVLGFKAGDETFDMILTMLILTAGADRVAALLQLSTGAGPGGGDAQPVEVQGTLTLDGREFRIEEKAGQGKAGVESPHQLENTNN